MISSRRIRYRKDLNRLWITLIIFCGIIIYAKFANAGDSHQNGQEHEVAYVILDAGGTPVSGQTVGFAMKRVSDDRYLDFSDNTFKSSGWTNRATYMQYNSTDGYYYYKISADSTNNLISGDYALIVTNDNATYKDTAVEVIHWDSQSDLIRIN